MAATMVDRRSWQVTWRSPYSGQEYGSSHLVEEHAKKQVARQKANGMREVTLRMKVAPLLWID